MNQIEKIAADIKSIESEITGLNTKLMMLQYEKEALSETSFKLIKDKISQEGFFLNKKAKINSLSSNYIIICIIYEPPVTLDRGCAKLLIDGIDIDVKWGEIYLRFQTHAHLAKFILDNKISIYLRDYDYDFITTLVSSGNIEGFKNLYRIDDEDVNKYMYQVGFYGDYNEADD